MNIYSSTFAQSLVATPDAPSLCVQGNTYTYRELEPWVNGCRQALLECGLQTGQRVALLASRSLLAYVTILACAAEGFTWVPLNPAFPDARNQRMLALSGAQVLVVGEEAADTGQRLAEQNPVPWMLAMGNISGARAIVPSVTPLPLPAVDAQSPAYLLFTSGTTGVPKGIPVSAGNLHAYLENFHALYPLPSGLRYSQMFDLTFDLSVHDLFVCWHHGGCLVIPAAQDLLLPIQFVRRQQIQVWFSVPSMASIAKQSGLLRPAVLPSLQYAFFCGEALPVSSADAWFAAAPNARVANLYGPTEATIAITAFELQRDATKSPSDDWRQLSVVPIGWPYLTQQVRVVRDDGTEAAQGESGELWLAGSQLTAGYLSDTEKTAAVFVTQDFPESTEKRWYRTGDCASLHPVFGLLYAGRLDRQVKINGFRVELQDIEHSLRQVARTELVAVLPWPQGADGLYTGVAGFVVQPGSSPEIILQELRELLPAYMQPGQILELERMPVNANGKVDYGALKQWLANGSAN
ncbi:MAG TPA: amino acid adenylation domain-containing protein [Dongiaceae bacterium]|nr:amino acid adenylation domain-containing protein [Dongiaceae bacterium]